MATKSFLTVEQTSYALEHFGPWKPSASPGPRLGRDCSQWLGERLLERLSAVPGWDKAQPILLGSWARHELCPKSDIDILFVGDEKDVVPFVHEVQEQGLKLRHRLPEDSADWSMGVEAFDVLALLNGRALGINTQKRLLDQQQKVLARGAQFRRQLLKTMLEERRERNRRFDSIANYLEPNLKYGAGGLRDIEQALSIMALFPERAPENPKAFDVLQQNKEFFLAVRQRLHLMGGVDIVGAAEQLELARFFGHRDPATFMSELQAGLGRASFYAEVLVERARAQEATVRRYDKIKFKNPGEAFQRLQKDPGLLMQAQVRSQVSELFSDDSAKAHSRQGRLLFKYFRLHQPEAFFIALFHSRLMEKCIPDLARIRGLVQHDQYHRFTVDTHLLQAVREMKRAFHAPKRYGKLSPLLRAMSKKDGEILLWAALYHDLAKGRQGDHSTEGAEQVRADLGKRWKFPTDFVEEVAWLVENHLILSAAAFRRNPHSPTTWKFLADRGAVGERLNRLAILTAVDIRATNPEAWNPWKERLLVDLTAAVHSPEGQHFMTWIDLAGRSKTKVDDEFVQELEPVVLNAIPPSRLLEDYRELRRKGGDLEPLCLRNRKGELWVRFHSRADRPGLFLSYVMRLYALGCTIQQSSIKTLAQSGVYDWFQVRHRSPPAQLKKRLGQMSEPEVRVPEVAFERMEMVASDDQETILSFRGRDQRGLLLGAAQALFDAGLTIRWAKVHTWGRQIDDVFAVRTPENLNGVLAGLEARLVVRPKV